MSDSCEGANCGRSDCPCKHETLNSSEESRSTLNSSEADSKEGDSDEADSDGGNSNEADSDRGDSDEADSDGGNSNEADSDGGDSDEADSDGGNSNEANYDGGDSDEAESDGGDSDEANSGGGDSNEAESDRGDSYEGDSIQADSSEGDSIQADSSEGDYIQADSKEGDAVEADSKEGDSIQADSNEGDPIEADSNEGDSDEADSSEWDSVEVDSSEGDSVEADSNERDSNEASSSEADTNEADTNEAGAIKGSFNEVDFNDAEWVNVNDFSERMVGTDGNYYDCDVCHGVGTLLCCESCPSTFHLECLEPPLESAPPGIWQCKKCAAEDNLSASKSSKAQSAVGKKQLNESSYVPVGPKLRSGAADQKLPAASSHSLDKLVEAGDVLGKVSEADAHSEDRQKSVINIRDEEGNQSGSNMGEVEVYKRSMWKKKVRMEEGVNLGKSSGVASDKLNEDHEDKPVHNPVEIDGKPVEEQGEAVAACQEIHERPYSGSPDVILQHKLSIPRDVTQASANGHSFSQARACLVKLPAYLNHEEGNARKEKLAYLRARQKARIAKRIKVGEPATGSGPLRPEGFLQFHGQNLNGFSGPSKNYSGNDPIPAIPLRMLRPEDAGSEGTYQSRHDNNKKMTDSCKSSFENLSVKSHQKRSNYNQEGFGDQFHKFPTKEASNLECLTTFGVKRQKLGISEFPSPLLRTSPLPQPRHGYPRKISSPDFFSGFPMASTGYNNSRAMDVDESWSSRELDSLWVGVRRHGQGNWLQMLTDRNLCFSKGKTAKALAERWENERASHFGPRIATNDKPSKGKGKLRDIDLNMEPSQEGLLPSDSSGKERSDEPKLLLGIHIEIPVVQPGQEAGGSGANQMQMQEAGGNGASRTQLQEIVEVSSDSEVGETNSDSEATISDLCA